jgi:hypothetical protein
MSEIRKAVCAPGGETKGEKEDSYEKILIAPILRGTTMQQIRARARWARRKLALHEKATGMSAGDAVDVLDRITEAEVVACSRIIKREAVMKEDFYEKILLWEGESFVQIGSTQRRAGIRCDGCDKTVEGLLFHYVSKESRVDAFWCRDCVDIVKAHQTQH